MKILFIGTDKFAVPALKKLLESPGYEVVGVVTQPDRPAGRKKMLTAPDVKKYLLTEGVDVEIYQPEKLQQTAAAILAETKPELIVVAAYGQMVPEVMINYPRYKCLNIHGSLLPMYRGAVPIEMALLNGDKSTGVSILQMTPGLDDGPVIAEAEVEVLPTDDAVSLRARLAQLGAELLYDIIPNWTGGSLATKSQDKLAAETGRTLSVCKISDLGRDRAEIKPVDTVNMALNKVKAFAASGYAWVKVDYKGEKVPMKIIKAEADTNKRASGLTYSGKQLLLGLSDGSLIITELQLPGKSKISGKQAGFLVLRTS